MKIIYDPTNKIRQYKPDLTDQEIHWALGYIPDFLLMSAADDAVDAIDENYQHGGGWHDFEGFDIDSHGIARYPGDPDLYPLAKYERNNQIIYQYKNGWIAVCNEDNSYRVARID